MKAEQRKARWLALAARSRDWQLERRLPELRDAIAAERAAQNAHCQARADASQACSARSKALSAGVFEVDALVRHAEHVARQQASCAAALESQDRACFDAQRMRERAIGLMAERDALVRAASNARAQADAEASRRTARQHDESWLLRRDPTMHAEGEWHED